MQIRTVHGFIDSDGVQSEKMIIPGVRRTYPVVRVTQSKTQVCGVLHMKFRETVARDDTRAYKK